MRRARATVIALALIVTACSQTDERLDGPRLDGPRVDGEGLETGLDAVGSASSTTAPAPSSTTAPSSTSTAGPAATSSTPASSTPASSTPTGTGSSAPLSSAAPLPDPALPATNRAFDTLARANPAVTLTVRRDDQIVLRRASGQTIAGDAATSDSPMVVASVSKLLTANLIARLADSGLLDIDQPTPWGLMGLPAHSGWTDVTPRELLDHTSGMPVVRSAWFGGDGDCRSFLPTIIDTPPQAHRGRWTYSNGNYCALGLLVETVTAMPLDRAAQALLFDRVGAAGVHLTTDGQQPADVAYALGVERLGRLGGAGTFIVSTDDLAAVVGAITPADRGAMRWPGLFIDQYGWGHTGTVDGAKSCVWVIEGGRTVIAATVAGRSPATGGGVCDRLVVAMINDLGYPADRPDRSPP